MMRAAARHHGEAHLAQAATHLACQSVVPMVGLEPRRAEHRDAGAGEVEGAEPLDALEEDANCPTQLAAPRLRTLQKLTFVVGP
jgi:hypothetical protein